ncbi:DUF305 domain-containing protein [Hoyosella subflava]|uniref:DUF305 domain-containing protein n=1 Tax=Hoyosella subflava (strain DSM 45089 / JCM 17490 / NBRC 109087 / DQS3-9A1) TaxID=443218 RepID=F6EP23_HOYSD|nr:DUF305 domain-containing protein [Hoyosella subflava]AEF40489.1 hypothetical protein AS9A_2040 [Hoyosella subflava DQS3-9A1]
MRKRLFAAVTAAGLAIALAACGTDDDNSTDETVENGTAEVSEEAKFNEADIEFAQGMIPHHEQAVEMSDIILDKDNIDPRVEALAEEIKAAQEPEIEMLEGWLEAWGADTTPEMDHDMHGMMGEDDLAALRDAEGVEAARLFLEQMIVHHEGAVVMAEAETLTGSNPEALELAQEIADTQRAEIDSMRMLLNEL